MELGGNIELIGFSEHEGSDLVIIKKIVGNFAKQLAETHGDMGRLQISILEVHRNNDRVIYELQGLVMVNGEEIICKEKDNNLYFALDKILKSLTKSTSSK